MALPLAAPRQCLPLPAGQGTLWPGTGRCPCRPDDGFVCQSGTPSGLAGAQDGVKSAWPVTPDGAERVPRELGVSGMASPGGEAWRCLQTVVVSWGSLGTHQFEKKEQLIGSHGCSHLSGRQAAGPACSGEWVHPMPSLVRGQGLAKGLDSATWVSRNGRWGCQIKCRMHLILYLR